MEGELKPHVENAMHVWRLAHSLKIRINLKIIGSIAENTSSNLD